MLRILYPVVPHCTYVLWQELGFVKQYGSILDAPWPEVDESSLIQSEIELVLQVNGKHRGQMKVPAEATKEVIEVMALQSEVVIRVLSGAPPKKVIVVPGRLVNVVA